MQEAKKSMKEKGIKGEDVEEEIFLSIEDWHEPVQINLGPNVGDITTGRKPATRSGVNPISSSSVSEVHEDRRWRFMKAQGPKPV